MSGPIVFLLSGCDYGYFEFSDRQGGEQHDNAGVSLLTVPVLPHTEASNLFVISSS